MLSSLHCRCTPPLPCFDAVPWDTLNASVHGRLRSHVDPFDACAAKASSTACVASLNSSDDEFWLTAQPAGYLHNGLFNSWNVSSRISPYVVAATTEQDVAAGLAFAHKHNLRVAVKSTGHDWFSRSSAPGSLLIWTHLMKAIDFHDGYVADGCAACLNDLQADLQQLASRPTSLAAETSPVRSGDAAIPRRMLPK